MKRIQYFAPISLILATLTLTSLPSPAHADKWTFDASLYGLAAGMTGEVGVGPNTASVDMGFADILENLEFGAMGKLRLGYGPVAVSADVIYMGLGGSKNGFSADLDQWVVEPSLSYRFCDAFELLAGARYNKIKGEIRGPFGRNPTSTQEWWDPIVGANVRLPLGEKFSFNFRGDVGGFGVGSDLTWQAFPFLSWQCTERCSLQAGYRWVYTDYETGSGLSRFKYDITTHGLQVGITFQF
ncbi:MAG: hypothetical protein AAB370_00100 [Verrucomicrobiota bacterium]